MKKLSNVTLMGIDCVDVERLQKVLDISSKEIQFAEVKLLTSLPTNDSRKVEIPHADSIEAYSDFCINELYKYVDTEFVLLVQGDGFVINPSSWEDEFLKYDYIGAPWIVTAWQIRTHDFPKDSLGKIMVGNGGFSLRSRKFLEASAGLSKEGAFPKLHPEDVALCVWYRGKLEAEGIKFAPPEVALRFSIESSRQKYENQFGFHDFTRTFKKPYLQKLIHEHPEWGVCGLFPEVSKEERKMIDLFSLLTLGLEDPASRHWREEKHRIAAHIKNELSFAQGLLVPTLDGTKTITLRRYREGAHDFVEGEIVRGRFKDGYNVWLRITTNTAKKLLGELTDEEAEEDGFKDAKDARNGLKIFYPDLSVKDTLAIVRYQVFLLSGKPVMYECNN